MLIPVPAGSEGPGGLLVVLEDYILYKNNKDEQLIRFPVRKDKIGNRKVQFTTYATFKLKGFFFLISS
jgi:splicing factor 3B subunit 3